MNFIKTINDIFKSFMVEGISNLMSFNLLTGVNFASRGMTEAIRADVGLIYFKVIVKKTASRLSTKTTYGKVCVALHCRLLSEVNLLGMMSRWL